MARVSQAHLDARRRQILDGAARCFSRNGFHATSLQDVLDEVGLSNGAVYRYFRSKDELITAIAEEVFSAMRTAFDEITRADPLPPLNVVLRRVQQDVYDGPLAAAHPDPRSLAQLVAQVWVETLRSPKLAALLREGDTDVEAAWERLIQAYQEAGRIPTDVSAPQASRTLMVVLRGFTMQQALFGDFDVDDLITGLRGLPGLMAWDEQSTPTI